MGAPVTETSSGNLWGFEGLLGPAGEAVCPVVLRTYLTRV